MGEAKRRGSREERVDAAIEHKAFLQRQKEIAELERRQKLAELEARLPQETRDKLKAVRQQGVERKARLIGTMMGIASNTSGPKTLRDAMVNNAALVAAAIADQQAHAEIVKVVSGAKIVPVSSSDKVKDPVPVEIVAHDEVKESEDEQA